MLPVLYTQINMVSYLRLLPYRVKSACGCSQRGSYGIENFHEKKKNYEQPRHDNSFCLTENLHTHLSRVIRTVLKCIGTKKLGRRWWRGCLCCHLLVLDSEESVTSHGKPLKPVL